MADVGFGEWLKNQRKIGGWTQKELALHVNCSTSTIRKIESEERHPSAQVVDRLAELFRIPASERKTFLSFARGDWQSISVFSNYPHLPGSMTDLVGTGEADGIYPFAQESPPLPEKLSLIHQAFEEDHSWSHVRLGYVALRAGNLEEALHIFVKSAQEFQKDKNTIGVVFTLEGLATLYIEMGRPLKAARIIGWADSTREKISDERLPPEQTDIDKILVTCSALIGNAAFSEAYEQGKKMSLGEAVAYALAES